MNSLALPILRLRHRNPWRLDQMCVQHTRLTCMTRWRDFASTVWHKKKLTHEKKNETLPREKVRRLKGEWRPLAQVFFFFLFFFFLFCFFFFSSPSPFSFFLFYLFSDAQNLIFFVSIVARFLVTFHQKWNESSRRWRRVSTPLKPHQCFFLVLIKKKSFHFFYFFFFVEASRVTRVTCGRSGHQSFRVCEVNLMTLNFAKKSLQETIKTQLTDTDNSSLSEKKKTSKSLNWKTKPSQKRDNSNSQDEEKRSQEKKRTQLHLSQKQKTNSHYKRDKKQPP